MRDLEYITTGMFTRFMPNTEAGENAWRVMEGAVFTVHLDSVLRQIRKAGLSVGKAKPVMMTNLLAELEM